MTRQLAFALAILHAAMSASGDEIPLSDISTTAYQEGLQHLGSGRRIVDDESVEEPHASPWRTIQRAKGGESSIFLVDGSDLNDAIRASAHVIGGYASASRVVPVRGRRSKTGKHWLVVYLGSGHSSPTKWLIESVTVADDRIRVVYRKPRAGIFTTDIVQYYFWIPLGPLKTRSYRLEIFDGQSQEVSLMRRVEVE